MYEELVKRLRDKASGLDYDGWVDTAASLEEAADAIEELLKNKDCSYRKYCPYWFEDGGFCSMLGKCVAEPPKEE